MGFFIFVPFVLAIFVAVLMFIIFTVIIISIGIGGLSASVFVKNKSVKRLLLIGFSVMLLIGLMCFCPFAIPLAGLPDAFIPWSIGLLDICIGFLAILGVKFSKALHNKYVRILFTILFYLLLIAVIVLISIVIIMSLIL